MKLAVAAVALLALAVTPVAANEKKSVYTDLNLDACQMDRAAQDDEAGGASWWCEGYDGIPVRVREGDLRFFVSYGVDADNEVATSETIPQFNTLGAKIEWRLEQSNADGSWIPFATILRFHADSGEGPKGSYLVVTKLGGPGQICHVARIDAVLNADANELARQTADEAVAGFQCGVDQTIRPGLNAD